MVRLILTLSRNKQLVPFDHNRQLHGAIGKWSNLILDHYGSPIAPFNYSKIIGRNQKIVKVNEERFLDFPNGGKLIFSTVDSDLANDLVHGCIMDGSINWGMNVIKIEQENDNGIVDGENLFYTLSPIFIRSNSISLFWNNPQANQVLTTGTIERLRKFDPSIEPEAFNNFDIKFISIDGNEKDQYVHKFKYDNSKKYDGEYVNNYPIIITGDKKLVELCYYLGLGKKTNLGLGCVSKFKYT